MTRYKFLRRKRERERGRGKVKGETAKGNFLSVTVHST